MAPTWEPVSLEQAKSQIRFLDDSEDKAIGDMIQSARETVEEDTGLVIGQSTWTYKLDAWPGDYVILPARPVQSVSSVAYLDSAGSSQTWSSGNYAFDATRVQPTLFLAYQKTWPTTLTIENAITITYVAGYASPEDVPATLKQMMLLLIARKWGDREGMAVTSETMGYERMLAKWLRSSYP